MSEVKSMENWNALKKVPESHLKTIGFGALKGKSDINPQWRYKAMTEVYGECGTGWSHRLVNQTIVPGGEGETLVFVEVAVRVKDGKEFTGLGGDKIVSKSKNGLKSNDEAFKMAYTDALGTALKYLGVASEIYEGNYDGSKYNQSVDATPMAPKKVMKEEQVVAYEGKLEAMKDEVGIENLMTQIMGYFAVTNIQVERLNKAKEL